MIASRFCWWAAIVAILAGAVATIPLRHLFEPDETKYAEVAREMVTDGHWIVPHLDGQPYTHKPPVFMWTIALGRLARLPWTAAAVLPPLLALLTLAWLVPRFAAQLGLAKSQGVIAFAMLASSPLVAALGLTGRMDMLLCLVHTASLMFLARLVGLGAEHGSNRVSHLAFWALVGLGVLIKGPVALALPLTTALAWRLLAGPSASLRAVFLGWGPLFGLGLVLAWLIPAALSGGREYIQEIVIRQSAGRIAQSFAHKQPLYYHLVTYPVTGLPWSPLVLLGLVRCLRRRAADGATFLAAAVLAVFAFFTIVSGKLIIYLLPLFPAGALLAAETFTREPRGRRTALVLGACGLLLFGIAVLLAPSVRDEFVVAPGAVRLAGGVLTVAAVIAGIATIVSDAGVLSPGPVIVAGLCFPAFVFPSLTLSADKAMAIHEVARTLREVEPNQAEILTFGAEDAGLSLYAERQLHPLAGVEDLRKALADGRVVVAKRSLWRRLSPTLDKAVRDVITFEYRRNPVVILRAARPHEPEAAREPPPGSRSSPLT